VRGWKTGRKRNGGGERHGEERGNTRNRWYLFHVEACPNIDEDPVGVGEVAFDVERVCERDEDGFVLCYRVSIVSGVDDGDGSSEGNALSNVDDPDLTTRRHSLNFAWAAASWAYELERCSTSPSSCFLTALSCWAVRVLRSTMPGQQVCDTRALGDELSQEATCWCKDDADECWPDLELGWSKNSEVKLTCLALLLLAASAGHFLRSSSGR
jgi:hypothetical protein